MFKAFISLFVIFFSFFSLSNYSYENLKVKDYEQMRKIINSYIQKTQKVVLTSSDDNEMEKESSVNPDEALVELKTALKVLFMRSDRDGLRSSLLIPLETEINSYKSFVNVLAEVVREALQVLKNKKSSTVSQVSALYIVENAISHINSIQKPEADKIFSEIAKAKIKYSDKLSTHLRLNEGRGDTASPSHIAKKILKQRSKASALVKKKAKAKAKAEAKAEAKASALVKKKAKAEAKASALVKKKAKAKAKAEAKASALVKKKAKAKAKAEAKASALVKKKAKAKAKAEAKAKAKAKAEAKVKELEAEK